METPYRAEAEGKASKERPDKYGGESEGDSSLAHPTPSLNSAFLRIMSREEIRTAA